MAELRCPFCGANEDLDPIEFYRLVRRCNNCQIALMLRNYWGISHKIEDALMAKWGRAHMLAAQAKTWEESGVNPP